MNEDMESKASATVKLDGEAPSDLVAESSWTVAEMRKITLKLDFTILPLVIVLMFFMQLDRANLSNALTDGFAKDIGISQAVIDVGQSLLWLGVALSEIPANIVLQKIGPHNWIPLQAVIWGLIAMLQCFIKNAGGFIVTRLLLGLAEGGFLPCTMYYLGSFYTKKSMGSRTAIFFAGLQLASACSSLIAYGVFHIKNSSWAGWRYLFVIDGGATIVAGIATFFLLPAGPHNSRLRFGWARVLDKREEQILMSCLTKDDPNKKNFNVMNLKRSDILYTATNWRLWPHLLMGLIGNQYFSPMLTFIPSIVKSLGFSTLDSNLLSALYPITTMVCNIIVSFLSDAFKDRSGFILFSACWLISGMISLCALPDATGKWTMYAVITFTMTGATSWHTLNVAWISANSRSSADRSVSLAFYFMAANLASIPSSYIFLSYDAPRYRRGFSALIVMIFVMICLAAFNRFAYARANREIRKRNSLGEDTKLYQL